MMLYEYHLLFSQPPAGKRMSFEDRIEEACITNEVPGVVLVADGPEQSHFQRAFGTHIVKEDGIGVHVPLAANATFSLASCTELMTAVAAMQCVERGLIALDEDITRVLPELKDLWILRDFDRRLSKPLLVRRKRHMTLRFVQLFLVGLLVEPISFKMDRMKAHTMCTARHLLTHTSGISHPAWNSRLYDYLTSQSRSVALSCEGAVTIDRLYPLIFEPGTSWEYGAGLDWAGKMVERLNNNITLQEYMETNIWTPLNITTATFRLNEKVDLKAKLPEMMFRQGLNHPVYGTTMSPGGRIVAGIDDEIGKPAAVEELLDSYAEDIDSHNHRNDDFGSSGAYCSAPDFGKILSSICSNDGKLLRSCTVNEMFLPQLEPNALARLQSFFAIKQINDIFAAGLPQLSPPLPLDWGLGGMLVMEDVPSGLGMMGNRCGVRRRKGSMFWAGLPNLYWWMDPQASVSGFYASQLLPQGDPRSTELFGEFEEWVYEGSGFGAKADSMGMGISMGISTSL